MRYLSRHFKLAEFTKSDIAKKNGLANRPSEKQIENLSYLCNHLMEGIRDNWDKPVIITSGYRSKKVNELAGGVPSSHHRCLGLYAACDFVVPGVENKEIFEAIANSNLPYDQCILEFGKWIHISFKRPKQQALIATKKGKKTIYTVPTDIS